MAGPSFNPTNANAKRSRKRSPSPLQNTGEEDEPVEVPAPTRKATRPRRAASREPESVAPTKAKTASRGKGKGKAKAEVAKDASEDVMDIDNIEEIREADYETEGTHEIPLPPPPHRKSQAKSSVAGQAAWKKQEARLRERLARLEVQLSEVSFDLPSCWPFL